MSWALAALALAAGLAVLSVGLFHPRVQLFGPCVWRGPRTRPRVALTFDDGPHPDTTRRVLQVLEAHGVKATFFVVGAQVERHPELARELVARGHELGNHTFRHGVTSDLFLAGRLAEDVARCQRTIEQVTGQKARWYRPAVGIRNPPVHAAARRVGLPVVTWSDAARDGAWPFTAQKAKAMAARAQGGDILVLHDGTRPGQEALREHTVKNLAVLLEGLEARGLEPVTLAALLDGAEATAPEPPGR